MATRINTYDPKDIKLIRTRPMFTNFGTDLFDDYVEMHVLSGDNTLESAYNISTWSINKEDTRSILKTITGFAVSRFQKSITSKLTTLTENIEDGNKIDIKKSFLKVLESVEELGSDVQDILPLIEEVDDLEKKDKEED